MDTNKKDSLIGGVESPDMAELRLTIGYMITELNSVIRNIGLHVSLLTNAIAELTDSVEGVRKNLQTSGDVEKHFGEYSLANTAYLNLRKIDDVSIEAQRIADNIEGACDPDCEVQMKVRADGDIMNHPY